MGPIKFIDRFIVCFIHIIQRSICAVVFAIITKHVHYLGAKERLLLVVTAHTHTVTRILLLVVTAHNTIVTASLFLP